MLLRKETNARERVEPTRETPVRILSASVALTVLTIDFDQPAVLKGVPQYEVNVLGAALVSADMTAPTTLELTFDVDVSLATTLTIPFKDPAVRSAVGGFVADSTFAV